MNKPRRLAIVGTSRVADADTAWEVVARDLGRSLSPERYELMTGACGGFPDALGSGFREVGGFVIGYSPGENLDDHIACGSPVGFYDELRFGFGGLIEREVGMLREADVVVALGGNVGTLSELCMAVKMERPLLIVDGFPGVSALFQGLLASLNVYPIPRVVTAAPERVGITIRALLGERVQTA